MVGKSVLKFILKVFFSPVFIALFIGLISYFFLFNNFYREYNYEVLNFFDNGDSKIYYSDIDNDGNKERILLNHLEETTSHSFIMLFKKPESPYSKIILSQTNIYFPFVQSSSMIIDDFDGDGLREFFVFMLHDSSVYLHGFKLDTAAGYDLNPLFDAKLIDKINLKKDNFEDFYICNALPVDINNDGYNELVFHIIGKYSAYPRKLYIYDIKNDNLISSDGNFRMGYNSLFTIKGNNSNDVIICPNYISSTMNVGDSSVEYSDRYAWIIAFNDSLKPLFNPIKLGYGFGNKNVQIPFVFKDTTGIISLYYNNDKIVLRRLNSSGKIIFKKKLKKHECYIYESIDKQRFLCTMIYNNVLYGVNNKLELTVLKKFDYNTPVLNFKYVNIDSDSDMEVLYLSDYFKVINLCDDDFSKIISLPNDVGYNGFDAQIIKNKKDTNYVFLTGNKKSKVIKYYKNSLYFLSFIFPLLVSLFFYIIIYYAVKRRERAIQQKHQQEKALIEAQLKIANKQMSPHFQLNVLNAIGYLFENDREKAQYYLGKYSRLVSNTMMNVDKITTTLENELEFTRNYLTLEQLRLDFKFDFDIRISDEVDMSIQIPRMLVFTFCENAVKHGLFHKKEKGNLRVELTGEGKNMEIKIEDNGIGRNKAKTLNTRGTGMGLKTLNKIVNHYNKMGNYKISFLINDLPDDSGTKVIISIIK